MTAEPPGGLIERSDQLDVVAALLSERTVDHHVSAVLAKLGVQTRAQAVHLATRDGLA